MKTKQIADVFKVSRAWARRVKQRRRETGETRPRKQGNPGVIKVDRTRLEQLVRAHPDATLAELRNHLGVPCATSTICMALKELGLSFKKRRSMRRNGTVRTSSNGGPNGGRGPAKSMAVV
jgi:transposase